jgi:hypothetical protein
MKKITAVAVKEQSKVFSDFSGQRFRYDIPEATLRFDFGYGSSFDDGIIEFHLSDKESKEVLNFIKEKLHKNTKEHFEKMLKKETKNFEESVDCRDYSASEYYGSCVGLYKFFLGKND